MRRLKTLASMSDEEGALTRTYRSPAFDRAAQQLQAWMRESGLEPWQDAIGNLRARWKIDGATSTVWTGSHFDTVINAGAYDGSLGLLMSLAAMEVLRKMGFQPSKAIELVGFCDEEGVRFHTTFLGSAFLAGTFDLAWLERKDTAGITLRECLDQAGTLEAFAAPPLPSLGTSDCFLELHLEQGPLLEQLGRPVGVVTAIAAQQRWSLSFLGKAGHAGTTPAELRQDALAAAAEFVLAVEMALNTTPGLRATVGQLEVLPGASNVIPGEVRLSLDIRHAAMAMVDAAVEDLFVRAEELAHRRSLTWTRQPIQRTNPAVCDPGLVAKMSTAAEQWQGEAIQVVSGAGHDALMLAQVCPVGMLFVACREGLSHHPEEYCHPEDIRVALSVWVDILRSVAS